MFIVCGFGSNIELTQFWNGSTTNSTSRIFLNDFFITALININGGFMHWQRHAFFKCSCSAYEIDLKSISKSENEFHIGTQFYLYMVNIYSRHMQYVLSTARLCLAHIGGYTEWYILFVCVCVCVYTTTPPYHGQ